jgi:hypothetical protein
MPVENDSTSLVQVRCCQTVDPLMRRLRERLPGFEATLKVRGSA